MSDNIMNTRCTPRVSSRIWLCVAVAALGLAVAAYLQKRGIEAGVFEDKEMGVHSFLFKDNDGNLIQFFTQDR